jgi:predicted nucleic acid-binding protein
VAAGYLLDTNLISETRKIRADSGVMAFLAAADAAGLFLSVLTLGELRKGVTTHRLATADRLGAWGRHRNDFSPIEICPLIHLPSGFGASCLPAALSQSLMR